MINHGLSLYIGLIFISYFAQLTFAKYHENQPCDANNRQWYTVDEDPHKFLYCDSTLSVLKINTCPVVDGFQKYFDEKHNRCVGPRMRNKRTPGIPKSSNIGETCSFNTDCKDNMYCPSGTCQCNPGFVGRPGSPTCMPTVNPGQPGCSDSIQCASGWPGATCVSGSCACPIDPNGVNTYYVVNTQDGYVCVLLKAAAPFLCPLPDYNMNPPTAPATIDRLSEDGAAATSVCAYGSNDDGSGTTVTTVAPDNYCDNVAPAAGVYEGDMYDCISTVNPPTIGSVGICCPTRSLTCIQPKISATATAVAPTTRYWYNSITGGCEPFSFDVLTGNSNSFLTPEFCLSYCGTACDHGPPLLTSQSTTALNRARTCTSGSDCTSTVTGQSYTCMITGVTSTCCASSTYVCSNSGGRQIYQATSGNSGPGPIPTGPDVGTASFPTLPNTPGSLPQRWFYNSATGLCQSFTYLGNAGNWNNFLSQTDCTTFCVASVCDQGTPLKTTTGANQACSGGRGCPTTYECKSNICCPRKQTVCIQPRSVGTCSSVISSYWFNAATGDCESFTYTGCGGNDNNFATYSACITYCRDIRAEPRCIQGDADKDSASKYLTCTSSSGSTSTCRANYECYYDGSLFGCCPIRTYTCGLSRGVGTACINAGGRWYYDTTLRSCQAFTYGGCDGNSNNFITRDACERYCGAGGCPYGGTAAVDATTNVRRSCTATASTCPSNYECQTITVSGSTLNACCLTRTAICQENPVQGSTSGASITRYYFNPSLRACTTFTFFGSFGNENNFATLAQCTNFCSSAACSLGQTVAIDGNQRVQTCNTQIASSCPTGYTCRQDTLFSRFVCCGSSDMGVCPAGEIAFIDAYTQLPRECRVGLTGDCYSNYLCRPNTVRGRNYCCAPAAGTYCPTGRAVSRDANTLQPQTCFLSALNACINGYTCQSTTTGQVQGFCCTATSICPANGDFAMDGSQNPRTCIMPSTGGLNPCPDTYSCQAQIAGSTSGYCCRGTTTSLCGTLTPVIDTTTNNARICSATVGCPTGACTANAQTGQSYCCLQTTTGSDPDGCGVGLIAYRETATNIVRQCTIGGANCPAGFSCQSTPSFAQNRCCGISSGCPTNTAAAINPATGAAQSCSGGTTCQSGFSCTTTSSFGSICCSTGATVTTTLVCPSGQPLASGNSFQTCSDTLPCPANYECLPTSSGLICCPSRLSVCSQALQVGTSCGTVQVRYYYEPTTGLCTQFTYNGCSGNDNNFISLQSCDLFCARGICSRGEPARSGSSYQFCSGGTGCSAGYQCISPRYGPTANQVCCPTTASSCTQGSDPGSSCGSAATAGITRYMFIVSTCSPFSYFGCGGNGNNFATLTECTSSCQTITPVTVRCPLPTQTPYVAPGGTSPQTCNPGPCPANFQCVNSGRGFICCSTQSGMCATGVVATNSVTGAAINCMNAACPTGYRCTYSATYRFYYCCSGGTTVTVVAGNAICPNNLAAYYTPGSATPARCSQTTVTGTGSCPPSYSCMLSSRYATTICCRSAAASIGTPVVGTVGGGTADCVSGTAFLYPGSSLALGCTGPSDTKCPANHSCSQNGRGQYQCCSLLG